MGRRKNPANNIFPPPQHRPGRASSVASKIRRKRPIFRHSAAKTDTSELIREIIDRFGKIKERRRLLLARPLSVKAAFLSDGMKLATALTVLPHTFAPSYAAATNH
jgi:hypothetical protein